VVAAAVPAAVVAAAAPPEPVAPASAGVAVEGCSAVPHSMQNLAAGGFSAPQLGQLGSSEAPQDMQKRARSGFSVPQLGQVPPIHHKGTRPPVR
jgi:hypothetical protein